MFRELTTILIWGQGGGGVGGWGEWRVAECIVTQIWGISILIEPA